VTLRPETVHYLGRSCGSYRAATARHQPLQTLLDRQTSVTSEALGRRVWRWTALAAKTASLWKWPKRIRALAAMNTADDFLDQKEVGRPIEQSAMPRWKGQWYLFKVRRRHRQLRAFYEQICDHDLNLGTSFVFCPLHYQPEKTTSPVGGRFVDQLLMIDMIAKHLPVDWLLYVKEHPAQYLLNRFGINWRSEQVYKDLLGLPNVRLVPLEADTFELIDRSRAVATVAGTAGWGAVLRGRPALTFGYCWYRDCEGVFCTPETTMLSSTLSAIAKGFVIDQRRVHLFLRALEEVAFDGAVGGQAEQARRGVGPRDNGRAHAQAAMDLLGGCEPEHPALA